MTVNKQTVFGITGGSGSGKSYISDIFRSLGVTVLDADKIGHQVCMPDGAAYAELYGHFGGDYFFADGTLDRKKLAARVFSDKGELDILNKITHKHIKDEIIRRLCACDGAAAIDGAVIIGSNIEELCEFMVGVTASEEIRCERIVRRDGISKDAAHARIAAQPAEEFYRAHCRYIIENEGADYETLRAGAEEILRRCMERS